MELKFADGGMISLDTIAVENEASDILDERSKLNYLSFSDAMTYTELVLIGDLVAYLKNVVWYNLLDQETITTTEVAITGRKTAQKGGG